MHLAGSIKSRLYLLTGIVGVIMLLMVLVFIWAGNTLTMVTAIARFERTHTISRVESFHYFDNYFHHKNPADLDAFFKKWSITKSYNELFGNLLEMRSTKSKKEFAAAIEKTFDEADKKMSEIIVDRINLLYWHPLIIAMVEDARMAHALGLEVDKHVKIILSSDNAAVQRESFKEIERIGKSFKILEDDFTDKSGSLGSEIALIIKAISLGILLLANALTGLAALLTIRSISIPIGRFIAYSKEVAEGNVNVEMPEISGDELLSLSDSLAILLDLNQRLKQEIEEKTLLTTELQKSEVRYQSLIMNMGTGIVVYAPDTSIRMYNPRAKELLGLSDEQLQARTSVDSEWKFINEDHTPLQIEDYPVNAINILKTPILNRYYGIERPALNDIVWVTVDGFPMFDSSGNISEIVVSFTDITERKRAEQEHEKLQSLMSQVQKLESLGVLAGGIAHDFNNLMGGVFGFIDLAYDSSDNETVNSHLSEALKAMERARALTQQLLTFAKGGAPIQEIGYLFPYLEEITRFALSGANVSCSFDVPEGLWACFFDKNQIGQVFENLVINAQQAMPENGKIEIEARNISLGENEHSILPPGNYIRISVKDTGIGISQEHISRIFDPFFTTKKQGHGLGLATCYSIINRHGGCIDVESEPGQGSTFIVYLPASTQSVTSDSPQPEEQHAGLGTFLVMDDEKVMRDTMVAMLESLGYNVVATENGEEAIEFFISETQAGHKMAGMIFDLTVPSGMGGKAAIKEIRRINTKVPAFVASGYADDPVMKDPTEYGFMASIRKPFRKVELAAMLNKNINL